MKVALTDAAALDARDAALVAANMRMMVLERERDTYRDALRNMMGAFDNAVSRRRYPPDDFMKECIKSGRDALASDRQREAR